MVAKLLQKPCAKAFPNISNKPFFVPLIEFSRSCKRFANNYPSLSFTDFFALLENDKYFTVHSVLLLRNGIRYVYNQC